MTPHPESISIAQARRLALAGAGLLAPRRLGLPERAGVRSAQARERCHRIVEHFGYLQIDTVAVSGARTHCIVLASRLPGLDAALAETLLAPGAPLFEYWGHEACWLPLSLYPCFAWRRKQSRVHPWWGDDLAIDGAKNFGRFEAFFLPAAQWEQVRDAFWARTGFPVDPGAAVERLKERLSDAFYRFLEGVADNRQVAFDDDGWRLKTDPAEPPDPAQSDRLAELHPWLDARSRTIRLADLLIEVENDLGFSVHFQQPGEKRVDPGEVCALLAAILAHGCNLGLYTMEKVAPDIAYRRLKYVSDWRLVEENQRAALAAIVHGISRLDAAAHWGDGTTSASDGQRFAMPHKVLQRTYSTRFNDFALEFYSFVADNYAPFYSRPIECTDRDAPFVLDGVLYHESDLNLEEHYTDTHGYTEINFAAFGMIGMRFCPRIRSLHRQRIYCADPARDHGVLEPVLQRGRRAVNFHLIAEQWDRIGQFYAAFPAGHATASAALQRLNRFQASNRFYAANRELGRALKTEFVLQYMSEPQLRAKVRRGLLKVEQLHALARAVYYGQRGRISAREVYDQMNACSCLTLILACIVYWQAREISRLAAAPDFPFDPDLLRHVSPIEWKNVIQPRPRVR